nr:hypothetical protein [Tanacetum cinerariifolium]
MTTLADKALLSGADNRPPILEKDMPRKYSELTLAKAIQADYNVKVMNIILQGLRLEVYALQGDDPIDAINYMMSFLSAVVTSRYPTTNNELRSSSNTRQKDTINDGIKTLQLVQGIQISFATGTTRTYTPRAMEAILANKGLLFVTPANGRTHVQKCTKPKKKQDDAWFKDKVWLVQAQANG